MPDRLSKDDNVNFLYFLPDGHRTS
jgi:hypothetical protein